MEIIFGNRIAKNVFGNQIGFRIAQIIIGIRIAKIIIGYRPAKNRILNQIVNYNSNQIWLDINSNPKQ